MTFNILSLLKRHLNQRFRKLILKAFLMLFPCILSSYFLFFHSFSNLYFSSLYIVCFVLLVSSSLQCASLSIHTRTYLSLSDSLRHLSISFPLSVLSFWSSWHSVLQDCVLVKYLIIQCDRCTIYNPYFVVLIRVRLSPWILKLWWHCSGKFAVTVSYFNEYPVTLLLELSFLLEVKENNVTSLWPSHRHIITSEANSPTDPIHL